MVTCEYNAMMFACYRCLCGIKDWDEFDQRKVYARQYKGNCTFQLLRKTRSAKCIPDDVVKQICKLTWEQRVNFFEEDDED